MFKRKKRRRIRKRRIGGALQRLEPRLNLSTVSVVSGELRIVGENSEDNTFTVDFAADTYTITDTNALTAGSGLTPVNQIDANTVSVPSSLVTQLVRVNMKRGTNQVTINDNGGAGWGDEGLFVRNDPAVAESTTIGSGGISIGAGAGAGAMVIQTDSVELGGDLSTSDNNPITIGLDTGDTVDVTANVAIDAGDGQVTANSAISSTNDSDLNVDGGNTFFNAAATGFGQLNITSTFARIEGAFGGIDVSITSDDQTTLNGTLTADSAVISSPDLNISSLVVDDLTIEAGDVAVSGTINPSVFAGSVSTLRSRIAGNPVTLFNVAAAATNPDNLVLDTTDLALFGGFEQLVIGGDAGGTQTSGITLISDGESTTRLQFPTDTSLIADVIDMDEGVNPDGNDIEFRTTTLNVNSRRAFSGLGNLIFQALPSAEGGDGTIAVTGKAQAFGGSVPALSILADTSATITAETGNFSSISIETPTATFDTGISAMTSVGDITFNDGIAAGALSVGGGLFADGNIIVNGTLDLLSDNLLYTRGGGDITVTGVINANGNSLQARGDKTAPAGTVSFDGGVSAASNVTVLRSANVNLGGTVEVNVAGGDVQIRITGNLSIGGDILSADRVDLLFATGDLDSGNRFINSQNDSLVQIVGDLAGTGTLTVDILPGSFIRVGANGGVTVNPV